MLERLQEKWKVGALQLFLILCTFAIGGSLTGYAARRIMLGTGIQRGTGWVLLYIVLITLLWPMAVLVVSVVFGQFAFFTKYLKRIGTRMKLVRPDRAGNQASDRASDRAYDHASGQTNNPNHDRSTPFRLAIFASGAGSNAGKIISYFAQDPGVEIALIVCNKPGAGVLDIAQSAGIPVLLVEKERFFRGDSYVPELADAGIDFIVLAGFLWKIPAALVGSYPRRIVNIHPALLPGYGGKGMYGGFVHSAVVAAGEKESGITIHYVDEHYDNGAVIFQASVNLEPGETAETLAGKIHRLEHTHYPRVIGEVIAGLRK